jgi:cytochrome c biogenesis protein CcdA
MRILFKILLFPLSLLLTIFVTVSMFVVERCAGLLNILSGIMVIAAVAGYAQYMFGWPVGAAGNASTLQLAIIGTVFAFTLSPYGLPMLAAWLLGKFDNLNGAIKSI